MKLNQPYLCSAELLTVERLRKPLAQLRALRKEGPRTDLTKWLACDIRTEIAALRAIRLARAEAKPPCGEVSLSVYATPEKARKEARVEPVEYDVE